MRLEATYAFKTQTKNGTQMEQALPLISPLKQTGKWVRHLSVSTPPRRPKLAEESHGLHRPSETTRSPEAESSPSLPSAAQHHTHPGPPSALPSPTCLTLLPSAHVRWSSPSFHVQLSCHSPSGPSPQGDLALHSAGTQWHSSASA